MTYGDVATLHRIAQADASFDLQQTLLSYGIAERGAIGLLTYHTANVTAWKKRVGEITGEGRFRGQCANLVQTATTVGETAWWLQGPRVRGNAAIPPGTALAAGWVNRRYPSKAQGITAAIFLEHEKDGRRGFRCLRQWVRRDGTIRPVGEDAIPPDGDGYTADMFYVILTVRRINDPDMPWV
jgi:hypothetical protein